MPLLIVLNGTDWMFQKQCFAMNSSPPSMYSARHCTATFEWACTMDRQPFCSRHCETCAKAPRYGLKMSLGSACDAVQVLLKKKMSACTSRSTVEPGRVLRSDERAMFWMRAFHAAASCPALLGRSTRSSHRATRSRQPMWAAQGGAMLWP